MPLTVLVILLHSDIPVDIDKEQRYGAKTQYSPREQSSRGQHGAHLGPVGPRWAPFWPHEPCCRGTRQGAGKYIRHRHGNHCACRYLRYPMWVMLLTQCQTRFFILPIIDFKIWLSYIARLESAWFDIQLQISRRRQTVLCLWLIENNQE